MTGTYKHLYFIGIVPPEPIYAEIKEFQQYVADKYRSKEALRRPTHATLIPPFQLEESREAELIKFVENIAAKEDKFELAIDGFGSFTVGVIYAAIVKNEQLNAIYKELSSTFYRKFGLVKEKGPSHAFTPHITVAFKDLSPIVFPNARDEFKDKLYRRKWMIKDICILRHSGKEWSVIKKVELGTANENILELGF
jgi:2'-5' RNA ligase